LNKDWDQKELTKSENYSPSRKPKIKTIFWLESQLLEEPSPPPPGNQDKKLQEFKD